MRPTISIAVAPKVNGIWALTWGLLELPSCDGCLRSSPSPEFMTVNLSLRGDFGEMTVAKRSNY